MPTVNSTLRTGRNNILKWIANSYNKDIPIIGNVGERLAPYVSKLRDPEALHAAGVEDDIIGKARKARNAWLSSRGPGHAMDMPVGSVNKAVRTGSIDELFKSLDAPHMARIKAGALMGGGFGFIGGLIDPDKNAIVEGVKGAAIGALFETFFPALQYAWIASSIAQMGVAAAGNVSRASEERLYHAMSGRGLYSQVDPMQNQFAGNVRRQSMGYMMQSKQNTRSFIGSEATYFHTSS